MIKFIGKAIDVIEQSKQYALLSNDHGKKAVFVGNRAKLAVVLKGVANDMVIATAGTDKKCIVLLDYPINVIKEMVKRIDKKRLLN